MAQDHLDAKDDAIWDRLVDLAQLRLQGQLDVALAADQRALVWGGLCSAAVAALATAAAICFTGTPVRTGLGYVCVFASVGLLVSIGLAVAAARPVLWFFPGTKPSLWLADIQLKRLRSEALQEFCLDLSDMIDKNERAMAINGKYLMGSVLLTLGTLALSVAGVALATIEMP